MGLWKRLFGGGDVPEPLREAPSQRPPLQRATPTFPFPLEMCRGADIPNRFGTLRKRAAQQGATLILIGDENDAETVAQQQELNEATAQQYLEQAAQVDVDRWLKERTELDPEVFESEPGEWPSERVPPPALTAHLDFKTNQPKRRVYCAVVPTPRAWEVPAYLRYGNWNDCPDAHYHVAMSKRWHDQYGAELVAVTGDTMEFDVARPPTDRDAAMRLVREQFIYCSDIVHQGVETVERLAATLLNGRYWFFWWD